MNNIKISQLDEDLSPSLDAITVVVFDDVAKNATIQSIKETIFSTGVTVNGTLDVTDNMTLDGTLDVTSDVTLDGDVTINATVTIDGDVTIGTDVSVDINGTISHTGNTLQTGNTDIVGDLMITGDTQTIYNWTSPNDTAWSIVECNGHNEVSITGSTGTIWFPFSGVPMSNGSSNNLNTNHLRGGVINYFSNCNGVDCDTLQTGTVHFTIDSGLSTQETRADFGCGIYFGEGTNDNGLKVYSDNPLGFDIIVQWSAKLFYAEEFFC